MANTRILYNLDTWDAATVTGSSQANTDLVPANVLHDHVSKLWRTTGKASENIVFDLGTATNITVFSMFTFNLTASATVTLQANSANSWGSPAYSQALTIATDADGNVLQRLVRLPMRGTVNRIYRSDVLRQERTTNRRATSTRILLSRCSTQARATAWQGGRHSFGIAIATVAPLFVLNYKTKRKAINSTQL